MMAVVIVLQHSLSHPMDVNHFIDVDSLSQRLASTIGLVSQLRLTAD